MLIIVRMFCKVMTKGTENLHFIDFSCLQYALICFTPITNMKMIWFLYIVISH